MQETNVATPTDPDPSTAIPAPDTFDFGDILEKEEKQDNGVWKELEIDGKKVWFRIAVIGQESFLHQQEKVAQRFRERHKIPKKKQLSTAQDMDVQSECIARVCIKDWRMVIRGVEMPCTLENKLKVMKTRSFKNVVLNVALAVQDETLEELRADEKNFESSCATN